MPEQSARGERGGGGGGIWSLVYAHVYRFTPTITPPHLHSPRLAASIFCGRSQETPSVKERERAAKLCTELAVRSDFDRIHM